MFDDLIRDGDEMTGNGTAGRQQVLFVVCINEIALKRAFKPFSILSVAL